ncbi:hypothetical protein BD779DRAFT_1671893 [Infundibulicybe gibba]|nr:hypothetical protein BD779DRAFT_1671893 [Infundibulicybe gibba]
MFKRKPTIPVRQRNSLRTATTAPEPPRESFLHLLNTDILLAILALVDEEQLPQICRVNRLFYECAQDLIYHRIVGPVDLRKFCSTIWWSPELAQRVHHIKFYNLHRMNTLPHHWVFFMTLLPKLSNLSSLTIQDSTADQWSFKQCSIDLHTFYCSCSTATNIDGNSKGGDFKLRPGDLPKLTSVSAPPAWLHRLVPDRPVDTVNIHHWAGEAVEFEFLAASGSQIESLTIGAAALRAPQTKKSLDLLSGLKELTVIDNYSRDTSISVEWISSIVSSLSQLRSLIVSSPRLYDTELDDLADALAAQVLGKARNLDTLSVYLQCDYGIWKDVAGVWVFVEERTLSPGLYHLTPNVPQVLLDRLGV